MSETPGHKTAAALDLVLRAQAGDRAAAGILVVMFEPALRRGIRTVFASYRTEEEVEEVLQASRLGFIEALPRLESAAALRTFAIQIGRQRAMRFLDKFNGQRQAPLEAAFLTGHAHLGGGHSTDLETELVARDQIRRLKAYLETRLSAQAWQVYELLMVQNLSAGEVATQLGISTNYVHQHTFSIRQLARKFEQEQGQPAPPGQAAGAAESSATSGHTRLGGPQKGKQF